MNLFPSKSQRSLEHGIGQKIVCCCPLIQINFNHKVFCFFSHVKDSFLDLPLFLTFLVFPNFFYYFSFRFYNVNSLRKQLINCNCRFSFQFIKICFKFFYLCMFLTKSTKYRIFPAICTISLFWGVTKPESKPFPNLRIF